MNTEFFIAILQSMPLAILIIVLLFFSDIKRLLRDLSIHSVVIAGIEMKLDNKDMRKTTDYLVDAMNQSIKKEEWKVFSMIISSIDNSKKKTLVEIFNRRLNRDQNGNPLNSETRKMLKNLRALRGFGLIMPHDESTWNDNSRFIITDFGNYISNHKQFQKLIQAQA